MFGSHVINSGGWILTIESTSNKYAQREATTGEGVITQTSYQWVIHDKIKNVCKSFTVIFKLFFRIHLLNLKELWTMDFAQLTRLRTNFVLVFESPLIPFTSSFFKSNFVLFGRCRNMLTTKAAIFIELYNLWFQGAEYYPIRN